MSIGIIGFSVITGDRKIDIGQWIFDDLAAAGTLGAIETVGTIGPGESCFTVR